MLRTNQNAIDHAFARAGLATDLQGAFGGNFSEHIFRFGFRFGKKETGLTAFSPNDAKQHRFHRQGLFPPQSRPLRNTIFIQLDASLIFGGKFGKVVHDFVADDGKTPQENFSPIIVFSEQLLRKIVCPRVRLRCVFIDTKNFIVKTEPLPKCRPVLFS